VHRHVALAIQQPQRLRIGAAKSPGRSAHRLSIESARFVYAAREAVADLFHAPGPLRVVFGHNMTEALNRALCGLLHPGDHVITSSVEHNSVMRPLRALEAQGVELTVVPCSQEGFLNPADVESALRPNTLLIVLNHAPNVVGTLLPVTVPIYTSLNAAPLWRRQFLNQQAPQATGRW
jgi:cysteine desulfurase/selenocysteine lyase